MLRVIEAFSGIGSQAQALKNINADFEVKGIIEWEIGAMFAYDILHNGPQDWSDYRHHTKDSLVKILSQYNLSNDGKEPLTDRALSTMGMAQLKTILCAIERNNNFVDITKVSGNDLPESDLLTYSFPCQDLSVSGYWHKNSGGIDRDAKNRSTLLWQIERILIEMNQSEKKLPRFLLMENVSNILSEKHIENFNEWKEFLSNLGYINEVYTLDARNFGIPQSRVRTYMLSVLCDDEELTSEINDYLFLNNLEHVKKDISEVNSLEQYIKLDYSIEKYRAEAIESTPDLTQSRIKILNSNPVLAKGRKINNVYARTVTTKQDRHPNSGIVLYENEVLKDTNKKYRNLTPRECMLLMGFREEQYDSLIENNISISESTGRKMLAPSKIIKLAGNSIVVDVLEAIFKNMLEINEMIEKKELKVS
ncbi:DNA (cytosine-5-)-methyltransferase [Macrococcoides bohemicum]|uniref:DNA (cytosine-5-)-methyltransferase n=1 Tax=Macrococcoides bohemicum TaxID=1903056 RepID=UPI00289AEF24|nr:DNA (cytosine-5-)-methyltransferase [Macrococcus bohemicus]